jgi:uncharacterized protein (TIGR02118 family)
VIKLIVAVKRNSSMTPTEFHRYWRVDHAAKVRALPATKRYVRRYVQAHTLGGEYAAGDPAYDGTAELWFDSVADKDAFYSDPEYLRLVAPDERVFADMALSRFLVTSEEDVL